MDRKELINRMGAIPENKATKTYAAIVDRNARTLYMSRQFDGSPRTYRCLMAHTAEEIAEFVTELCMLHNGTGSMIGLTEEMLDANAMIDYLPMVHGIPEEKLVQAIASDPMKPLAPWLVNHIDMALYAAKWFSKMQAFVLGLPQDPGPKKIKKMISKIARAKLLFDMVCTQEEIPEESLARCLIVKSERAAARFVRNSSVYGNGKPAD